VTRPRANATASDVATREGRLSPRLSVVLSPEARAAAVEAATAAGVSLSGWLDQLVRGACGLPTTAKAPAPPAPKRPRGRPRKNLPPT